LSSPIRCVDGGTLATSRRKKQENDIHWTFAAIVLVGCGLFLLVSESDMGVEQMGSNSTLGSSSHVRVEDRINLHLKSADVATKLGQYNAEQAIPRLSDDQVQVEDINGPLPLDRKQAVHSVQVTREQEANDRTAHTLTPSQQIELDLARKQFMNDYDHKAREQFIQDFLNNARENGFEIQLDENLEVVSVKRNPALNGRQPNSETGSPSASK
jgi:hypothetical protein